MEFKGTKGPWEINGFEIHSDGKLVGFMASPVFNNGVPVVETYANCKLVSCAPEMLEMLKGIYDCYEKKGHLLDVSPSKIKKLIEKATDL